MAATRVFLFLPSILFLSTVAACGGGTESTPPPTVTVNVHLKDFYFPNIIFQDQTGATVATANAKTPDASATADLPDGGTVIAYTYVCAPGEPLCKAATWAVRGVQPGDTITMRERSELGPTIEVAPGPVESAVMDCDGSWYDPPTGVLKWHYSEAVSLLVLGPYPQTFPSFDGSAIDPSTRWGTAAVGCH